jgi:predicted nucleotidyltransferase
MPSSIALTPEQRTLVESILSQHVPGRTIVAFGSRVRGTPKPTSDIDLCILGAEPLPPIVQQHLADAFSASTLPFKVDLVDWATLSEQFRSVIEETSQQLWPHP